MLRLASFRTSRLGAIVYIRRNPKSDQNGSGRGLHSTGFCMCGWVKVATEPESIHYLSFIGIDRTESNILTVLKKANDVSKFKDWLMTARCFSLDETEDDSPPTQQIQTLAKIWRKTERNEWWRLAMNLIRCCSVKDVKRIHEFMKNVAKYNHSGKLFSI